MNFNLNLVLGVCFDVDILKLTALAQSINSESQCTWILGVVSKQLRLLHGRVADPTTVVNSLSPQMSELVVEPPVVGSATQLAIAGFQV